jgi:hypothetical protein
VHIYLAEKHFTGPVGFSPVEQRPNVVNGNFHRRFRLGACLAAGKTKGKKEYSPKKYGQPKLIPFHTLNIDRKKGDIYRNWRKSMDFDTMSDEKKHILLDLADKAIGLRPGIAGLDYGEIFPDRVINFARDLARSIIEPASE